MKKLLVFLLLTLPLQAQDTVRVRHGNYESVFSVSKRYPVLVEWTVTRSKLECKNPAKRTDKFLPDPNIKKESNIDEDEFEVSPAINRVLQVVELDKGVSRKQKKINDNPASTNLNVLFVVGNSLISQRFDYTVNLNLGDTKNVKTFEVYINNLYYGENVGQIQINTGDVLKIEVTKNDDGLESTIQFNNLLL